jgi:hypothetical protein
MRSVLVAAVAVAGLGTLSAREARATCGDYLYHGPMAPAQKHAATPDANDHPAQPAERRCHGPGCRDGNPPLQVPQRTPVRTQRIDQFAIADAEPPAARSASRVSVSDAAALLSRGHRSRVERPPRG